MAFQLNPQQQEWWQKFLQQRQASLQQNLQTLRGLQPWQQPGYTRMANPLLSRTAIPADQETDPQAAMLAYFMPQMGDVSLGGSDNQMGATTNPMLMQMLLSGSIGFGGL